jgi:hypothetical protein
MGGAGDCDSRVRYRTPGEIAGHEKMKLEIQAELKALQDEILAGKRLLFEEIADASGEFYGALSVIKTLRKYDPRT